MKGGIRIKVADEAISAGVVANKGIIGQMAKDSLKSVTGKTTDSVKTGFSQAKGFVKDNIKVKGNEVVLGKSESFRFSVGGPGKNSDGTEKKLAAKLPHWHYAKKDNSGKSIEGQGKSRHRPWETVFKRWFR